MLAKINNQRWDIIFVEFPPALIVSSGDMNPRDVTEPIIYLLPNLVPIVDPLYDFKMGKCDSIVYARVLLYKW